MLQIAMKTFILIIVIKYCKNCRSYFSAVNDDLDNNVIDQYPWTVIIYSNHLKNESIQLYHGSLINPWAVLTMLIIDYRKNLQSIRVYANCGYVKLTSTERYNLCEPYSDLSDYIIVEDKNKKPFKSNKINILILSEPFKLDNTINIINLVNTHSTVNTNQCVMFSLRTLYSKTNQVYAKYVAPIRIYLKDDYTVVYQNNTTLINDNEKTELLSDQHLPEKFGFLGSPVACQLKNEANHYVQVGVTDSWSLLYAIHFTNYEEKFSFGYTGSIIDTTTMYILIRDKLLNYGIDV